MFYDELAIGRCVSYHSSVVMNVYGENYVRNSSGGLDGEMLHGSFMNSVSLWRLGEDYRRENYVILNRLYRVSTFDSTQL